MNYIDVKKKQIKNDLHLIRKHEEYKDSYVSGTDSNLIVVPSRENLGYEYPLARYTLKGITIDFERASDELFDTSKGRNNLKELIVKKPYPKNIKEFMKHMVELRPNVFEIEERKDLLLAKFCSSSSFLVLDADTRSANLTFLRNATGGITKFACNEADGSGRLVPSEYKEFEKILLKVVDFIESFK